MIVLDSSALIDLLAGADDSAQLRARVGGELLHAPTLLDYEVIAAARKLTSDGKLTERRAMAVAEHLDAVPIRRWPTSRGLRRRAFELRHTHTAYDAAYVALAEALECPLVTRDARLARSHGHEAAIELH